MDTTQALQHLQIEFFLLHNLASELGLIKRTGRGTPADTADTRDGSASLNRLMRSCLVKVFPSPFSVSKRPYRQEFEIGVGAEARRILDHARDQELCRELQAGVPSEIGILRFRFPDRLIITMAGDRIRYSRWYPYHWGPDQLGIARYCPALRAAIGWKKRFEAAIAAATDTPELYGPQRNLAQERLDALFANRRA